ncbi:MAG TPA: hypothetical protein DIT32_03465 [Peptococcaceae bacterium]|nr:hypothetical protein [Peptococcaceae bacterium]
MNQYSGYTAETPKNLLLDAGAFFKNFQVGTDTFSSAVTDGKLLGATSGGGNFSALPTLRKIEIDGVKGAAKGLEVIDEWVVTLTANVKEIKKAVLQAALVSAEIDTTSNADYDIISANNDIALTDYIDNITWVGKLSGTNDPVIIQVYNALSTGGLTLNVADKAEAIIALSFTGHYDDVDLDSPPFKIYYPKAITNSATVNPATFSKAAPADITFTITSSDSAICGGVRLGTYTLAASEFTLGTGTVLIKKEYLADLTNGDQVFTLLMDKGNNITAPKVTVGA